MTSATSWSREERALFNPAFTGLVCARVVQGHAAKHNPSCRLPIVVMAAIMAFQPAVRDLLPKNTSANLPKWVEDNGAVKVHMAANVPGLADVVRPGLLFALQTGVLALDSSMVSLTRRAIPAAITGTSRETTAIQKAAHMLGRWLPTAGSTATTLTLLGVRP
ncbi:three component ABC system middle component [Actinosynnema mirum]|uniref:Uncharacterized protein n=1 Tax=Actinosynnema mirum (strain ATCC 29888 / DSM 43827 / JCM 3225 / NBRC 14064 / NCIMB 13271 / NRRL B-12336 / IMRU 3971 / 101) TaxID=446462 RepID=C6W807_ACTMD|nr:three component ABC system middle component [Actinosynnema mirum]ACU37028.1 conserved hypothetical protein [Actinosynnema mirum DSM 43827]